MVDERILTNFVLESNAIEGIPARAGLYHDVHLAAARSVVENYEEILMFDSGISKLHEMLGPVFDAEVPIGRVRKDHASFGPRTFPAPRSLLTLLAELQASTTSLCVIERMPKKDLAFKAWEIHHRFVCIHPFADGNGRVARLLLNAVRLNFGLPWQIIYNNKVAAYYRAIRAYEDEIFRPRYQWAYDAA